MPDDSKTKPTTRSIVCRRDELAPGEMRSFKLGRTEIVLARKDEETFYAVRNACPHMGADLSKGLYGGMNVPSEVGVFEYGREGEILRCPWHAWEFDITTGCSLHDPARQRVKAYTVVVDGDDVLVEH
jgi:nitrite reductase/ring-hydroxylating ferredoxin subunit